MGSKNTKSKVEKQTKPQYHTLSSISYSQIYEINLNYPNLIFDNL